MKRLIALALLAVWACGMAAAETAAAPTPESVLAGMTLREKVGQLFCIRPESLDRTLDVAEVSDSKAEGTAWLSPEAEALYRDYPAGGFALFKKNLRGPEQLEALTAQLHALGSVRPVICVDEEGGMIARLANSGLFDVPKYPNMQEIAETGETELAFAAGAGIGTYLAAYGIDATFAPVADVNTNPDNPVIGKRAFGDDPRTAALMVSAYLDGLHGTGTMGCVKHFPGHGDTRTDTHSGYAETAKTWDEMLSCEMLPFISGIGAGTDMVMIAHISAPAVTGDRTPATLSPVIVTDKLRTELGFTGVIVTDGMEMGAVTAEHSPAEAAVAAIRAGVDVILLPADYLPAFEGVLEAVLSGEIPEERIDESVLRILTLKQKYGLL